MDRSKWEYKKLGDICTKLTDGSHNPPKGIEKSDYRMISSQNIFNDKIVLADYRCLTKEDFEVEDRRTALKKGDLLLTIVGAIGRCYVLNGTEGNLTLQRSVAALTPKDYISSRYLMYYFIGNNAKLIEEAHGVAQKGIYLRQLANLMVPVPPSDNQQQIVAELDCLNEMIAVKQEQLKEFDKLAQSIFYDMFGDPITKNKKWETIKLEKITIAEGGGTPSKNIPDYWNGDVVWVTSKDMKQMYISDSQIHITEDGLNNSPAHILPKGTILLVNRSGILKHTLPLAITTKEVSINQDLKALTIKDERFISIYVLYTLKAFAPYLLSKVKAVTVDSIEFSIFKKLDIPLSPLTLQQQFAEKISAIEAQKELVKASIAETQQLLDSRMDYYFD